MAPNSENSFYKLVLLQALQSITNLGPFYDLLALGPIPVTFVSNAHYLQNFFSSIQPPDSKLAYSSGNLYKSSTFRPPPLVSP
jgi:hypothetical protein